jgi:hypothetical protein
MWVGKLPLQSILLANVQSLGNKLDEVRSRISYQLDIKNCNILCFTESWLNDDMDIQLAGYTLQRLDRTAHSKKTRGGSLCIFVNNSWCTKSKEVSRFCSPEVEYLMINCRPHYLPREFSSQLFVAVYLPPQTDAGTKTALSQLYKEISKQETEHPKAVLLVVGDFNARKLKSVLTNLYQHVIFATRGKTHSRSPVLQTQRCIQISPSPSIW